MLTEINAADTYKPLTTFRLDQLIAPAIGDGMTYATYPGGLTTPPCNEVIMMTMMMMMMMMMMMIMIMIMIMMMMMMFRWSPGSTSSRP